MDASSARHIGPPPGLVNSSSAGVDQLFRSLHLSPETDAEAVVSSSSSSRDRAGTSARGFAARHSGTNVQQSVPKEVRVKNTFIHVEDPIQNVPQLLQRSRSDSDLSSGSSVSSGMQSQQLRASHQNLGLAPPIVTRGGRATTQSQSSTPWFDPTPGPLSFSQCASSSSQEASSSSQGASSSSQGASSFSQGNQSYNAISPAAVPPFQFEPEHGLPSQDDREDQDEDEDCDWSVGSANHDSGGCKPCVYFRTEKGCHNGRSCNWCHMPHEPRHRARPGKAQRARCKQIARMFDPVLTSQSSRAAEHAAMRSMASGCATNAEKAYLREIVSATREQRQEASVWQGGASGQRDVSAGYYPPRDAQHDARHQPAHRWKMAL